MTKKKKSRQVRKNKPTALPISLDHNLSATASIVATDDSDLLGVPEQDLNPPELPTPNSPMAEEAFRNFLTSPDPDCGAGSGDINEDDILGYSAVTGEPIYK